MAAPCVSCTISTKLGENTDFVATLEKGSNGSGNFTHKALQTAVSTIQSDVNSFLTALVEEEKRHTKSTSNSISKGKSSGEAGDATPTVTLKDTGNGGEANKGDSEPTGDNSDDLDLDEDDEDDEDDQSNTTLNVTLKRDAAGLETNVKKKSKILDL